MGMIYLSVKEALPDYLKPVLTMGYPYRNDERGNLYPHVEAKKLTEKAHGHNLGTISIFNYVD